MQNHFKGSRFTNENEKIQQQSDHQRDCFWLLCRIPGIFFYRSNLHRRMGIRISKLVSDSYYSMSSCNRLFCYRRTGQRHAQCRCMRHGLLLIYDFPSRQFSHQYLIRLLSCSCPLLLRIEPAEYDAVFSGAIYLPSPPETGL